MNKSIKFALLGLMTVGMLAACGPKVTLDSIKVTAEPTKTEYWVNEEFDSTGLEVTAVYSNETEEVVTDYELSTPDMTTAGEKEITVTYEELTASFNITVRVPELTGIAVTAEPTKTEYKVGDTLDPTGLEVTASYSDGNTAVVTDYTLSTPDMTTAGQKEVTVTYEEKTASFNINVTNYTIEGVVADANALIAAAGYPFAVEWDEDMETYILGVNFGSATEAPETVLKSAAYALKAFAPAYMTTYIEFYDDPESTPFYDIFRIGIATYYIGMVTPDETTDIIIIAYVYNGTLNAQFEVCPD